MNAYGRVWREENRRKYCDGICSKEYLMTREPQSVGGAIEIAHLLKENWKNTEYAIKHRKRRYNKRRVAEDRIVFE